jgi:hypothetical protein
MNIEKITVGIPKKDAFAGGIIIVCIGALLLKLFHSVKYRCEGVKKETITYYGGTALQPYTEQWLSARGYNILLY